MEQCLVPILYPSNTFSTSAVVCESDSVPISQDLNEKLGKAFPCSNLKQTMSAVGKSWPKIVCMMDYSLDDAILQYRKLF